MTNLVKRLRASVRIDAVNGTATDRAICENQMLEAANEIERLESALTQARAENERLQEDGEVWRGKFNEACSVEQARLLFSKVNDELTQAREDQAQSAKTAPTGESDSATKAAEAGGQ